MRSTVENARNAVNGYVEDTKKAFDIREYVKERPWTMFGASVATGLAVARALSSESRRAEWARVGTKLEPRRESPLGGQYASLVSAHTPDLPGRSAAPGSTPRRASLFSGFESEIEQLKSMAITSALEAARDFAISRVPPSVAPKIREFASQLNQKLGRPNGRGQTFDGRDSNVTRAG